MLRMAKKTQRFQFLFSTEDLDFDPKRVEVVDSKTGKKIKIESTIKAVGKKREKIFGVRMAEDEIHKIRKTARKADMKIGEFARGAIERAVKEVEEDSKRQKKK